MWSKTQQLRSLGISKVAEHAGVQEYRLDANGLRILLVENHNAPVFVHLILFKVGGANEGAGQSGFAHLLEHLKYKGNNFDETLNRFGADNNASTGLDVTDYHVISPSEHLETVIKLEALRVRNLPFTDGDHSAEVKVVLDEIAKYKKDPDDALTDKLMAKAFKVHPYRIPVLGSPKDLKASTAQQLKDFNNTFYWPNNATVILVGDFDSLTALTHIKQYYGVLPASPGPVPTVNVVEPAQHAERRFTLKWKDEIDPRVVIGYRIPEATHEDTAALSVLAYALGSEEKPDSILYKTLIESEKASEANAVNRESVHPDLFHLTATCESDVSPDEVEDLLLGCIEHYKTNLIDADLLKSIKTFARKDTAIKRDDLKSFAEFLAESQACVNWQWRFQVPDFIDAVTPDDVMRVAKTYFTKANRVVGHLVAPNTVTELASDSHDDALNLEPNLARNTGQNTNLVSGGEKTRPSFSFEKRVKRIILPNGLTIVAMSTPGTGTVSLSGFTRAGEWHAPCGQSMIPEIVAMSLANGTEHLSKDEISKLCHEMDSLLDFDIGETCTQYTGTVVKEDLANYLSLIGEVITKPAFKTRDLRLTKTRFKTALKDCAKDTAEVAILAFNQALYPPGHLMRRPSYDEAQRELASIDRNDLVQFHQKYWTPSATVLAIVGDFDADKVLDYVPDSLKNWSGPQAVLLSAGLFTLPSMSQRIDVKMSGEDRPDIVIGLPVELDWHSSDIAEAIIANSHLGGDTTMGRLGKVVRDTHGLTYGIVSALGDLLLKGGIWNIQFATKDSDVDKALALVDQVWREFYSNGLSEEQLIREKSNVKGKFAISMSSTLGIANVLAKNEYTMHDLQWLDDHSARFDKVTVDSVNAAIKKHFDMNRSITVVAGAK